LKVNKQRRKRGISNR